jgi:hypothetical protein
VLAQHVCNFPEEFMEQGDVQILDGYERGVVEMMLWPFFRASEV